jgi:hypothetical protein
MSCGFTERLDENTRGPFKFSQQQQTESVCLSIAPPTVPASLDFMPDRRAVGSFLGSSSSVVRRRTVHRERDSNLKGGWEISLPAEVRSLIRGDVGLNIFNRPTLKKARDDFKELLGNDTPEGNSYDRYQEPIRVRITGCLFFDTSHHAGDVGPQGLKPRTTWEIHPVTRIVFQNQ